MEIISIHLMLLLNDNQNVETTINESNFNTSYVVIKLLIVCDISNFERISIHLMLLLNLDSYNDQDDNNAFQYILCCY